MFVPDPKNQPRRPAPGGDGEAFAGAPLSLQPPTDQSLAALPALERAAALLPAELSLQTDRLTGMHLKNILYSDDGRSLIDAMVPGAKRFVLFDCQHAGAANSYGAGTRIDSYFASLAGTFQRSADQFGFPHVALRLGGDEFALVVPSDERTAPFLRRLAAEIEKSREVHLGHSSNELGSYVIERDTMRAARNDYRRWAERENAPYTAAGFLKYMHDNFVPLGPSPFISRLGFHEYLAQRGLDRLLHEAAHDPRREYLVPPLQAGFLQKYIVHALVAGMSAPAGRFSMSSVDIGAAPTWEDYHRAEGAAAKRIQATKDRVFTLDTEQPLALDRNIKVKQHEALAQLLFHERESEYRTLRESVHNEEFDLEKRAAELHRLVMLAVGDPNLPGIIRGDLIRSVPAEVVLGRKHDGPIYALIVNARSFGVVNNSKSYEDADRMLSDVAAAASREFSPFTIVRQGGGKVILLGAKPFDLDQLAKLEDKLSAIVQRHIIGEPESSADRAAYERMKVEYGERFALNSRWQQGRFVTPAVDFGRCEAALAMIQTESDKPLDLLGM